MRAQPMISSSVTVGLLKAIKDAGIDPSRVFERLDLDPAVFSRDDGFIPCSGFARVLEQAAVLAGDRAFGLHFGASANPKNIGALAYAVFNAPTVAVAFETAARYLHIHNEAALATYKEENNLSYLRYGVKDLGAAAPEQFIEYGMAVAFNTLRVMVGSQWNPREVHFAHDGPPSTSEHQQFFRAPVLFSCPTSAFVMEREFCSRPIPAADSNLFEILRRYLEDVLSHVPKEDESLAMVRRKIAETIKEGNPKLDQVAKAMALSPRTLQRQLNEYGIDFRTLVDDTRKRFAQDYLKDSSNTLTQIAFLLGYSELSAFNRSFKRWTGKTPLAYRRSFHP